MSGTAEIAQVLALVFAIGVLVLVFWVAIRRALRALLMRRVDKRVERAEQIIAQHRKTAFLGTERLLFQLGELADVGAVESVLNAELERAEKEARPGLVKLYRALGIIERYRLQLRESTRWTERVAAAHALGRLRATEAVGELVEALRDPHEDARSVKLAAAQALGRMKSPEAVPLLLDELETVDEWASPRIAEVLAAVGEPAVPTLIAALDDEKRSNSRVWAAQILGRIEAPTAVPALVPHLRDRSEQVRMSVAEALGRMGDRRSVGDLVRAALRDPVPPVRAEAARALGEIGDPDVVRSLVELLGDPDYWTRLRAIEAIEAIGPDDTSPLEAALRDASKEVRRRAAVALERVGALQQSIQALRGDDRQELERARAMLVEMGRAGLLDSLLSYLDHEDFRARARVADLMGDIGDIRAVRPLEARLTDEMWPVRVRAVEAIGRLRPEDGVRILLPLLTDDEESVREAAAEAIRSLGPPTGRDELKQIFALFDTGNAVVRCTVMEAISEVQSARVDDLLGAALGDPNGDVRLRATQAISRQARVRWVDDLVQRLGDSDMRVRAAAATALGEIGTPESLEWLVRHLDTPDRLFREALTTALARHGMSTVLESEIEARPSLERTLALVWSLGKTGSKEAVPRLRRLAEHPDHAVRAAVAGALGKLGAHVETFAVLKRLLRDRNERVRAAGVNALARACTPGVWDEGELIEVLEPVCADPDDFVRSRVALALGQTGGEGVIPLLHGLWDRAGSSRERAAAVVGYALTGLEDGLEAALTHLDEEDVQSAVDRLLVREPEELRERFSGNLHLGLGSAEPALSWDELAKHYIGVLSNSQRPEARAAAVAALQAIGVTAYRELFVDTVRTDPDPDVRALALQALIEGTLDDDMGRLLLRSLRDPSSAVQVRAARGLAKMASPAFNAELLECFGLGHAELDTAVVGALAAANRQHVIEFVDELLGSDVLAVQRGGARVLGEIGDARAVGVLSAWLSSRDSELRRTSVTALGRIGTVEAREAVIASVGDPWETVRLAALEALGHLHSASLLEAAAGLVTDPSLAVRVALARLLGRSRNPDAITLIEQLCGDPQERVRLESLVSLLLIGDAEALESFGAQIQQQTAMVKRQLAELQPAQAAVESTVVTLRSDRRVAARVAALEALIAVQHRPVDTLIEAMGDPAPEVRLVAVERSAELGETGVGSELDERLEARLHELLDDPDERVREAVRRGKLSLIG